MSIFSRLGDIINSNLNSMLERARDPEKIIRLIIQEMEETLVEVRSSAVRSIAEKKELERRADALEAEAAEWERKAELALSKNREDLARGALQAKARIADALAQLAKQREDIDAALDKQNEDLTSLQDKLADAKAREKALLTRRTSAANRLKMRGHLHDSRIGDAFSRFDQIERELDELEGKVESYDLGRGQGGDARKSLHEELADLEADTQVEDELARLKARMKGQAS